MKRRYIIDQGARYLMVLSGLSSILVLALIAVFVIREGLPTFQQVAVWDFLFGMEWRPSWGQFGILPMIVGSVCVTAGAMAFSVPLGIGCAVLLAEVSPYWLRQLLRPAVDLLVGIPSVVYGLVGMTALVPLIRQMGGSGYSVLGAIVVLTVMVLPTIISVSEDAIRAVPREYKEGSLALGTTHWQALWHVMLPSARSGIVAGVVLAMGRAIGETMAMIMVIGNSILMPTSPLDPARTLTGNIAVEINYAAGVHWNALFATGIVLFAIILVLNSSVFILLRRQQVEQAHV